MPAPLFTPCHENTHSFQLVAALCQQLLRYARALMMRMRYFCRYAISLDI